MPLTDLRMKVEEKTREHLTGKLLDRYVVLHQKWDWRDCPCSFCKTKRVAHTKMQFSPFYMRRDHSISWREGQAKSYRRLLAEKVQEVITSDSGEKA